MESTFSQSTLSARQQMAQLIDHACLRADATQADIDQLCDEARRHRFKAVSVNSAWTAYCAKRLAASDVLIAPTIGFPLGATTAHMKVEEAKEALANGANELDVVINVGALKSGFPSFVAKEIEAVVHVATPASVKVILETAFLSDTEKIAVCQMAIQAGAAFVKTSTGFASSGAMTEDIELLRGVCGTDIGIKAAGGIRGYRDAAALLEAGASRLGTSASLAILQEMPAD